MTRIMHSAAEVVPMLPLLKKKSGTPTSAADPKHTSCRFVRPNSILLLIFCRLSPRQLVPYAIELTSVEKKNALPVWKDVSHNRY